MTKEHTQHTERSERILQKRRRAAAAIVDFLLHIFFLIHSTLTLRRFTEKQKQRIDFSDKTNTHKNKKVVVYASMFIGELIIALESLSAIKKKYPHTTIICHPSTLSLLTEYNTVPYSPPWFNYGERISLKGIFNLFLFIHKMRKEKFDIAIDMRGDLRNNLLLYLFGAPVRVGYPNTGGGYFLTHPVALTETLESRRNAAIAQRIGATPREFTILTFSKKDTDFIATVFKKNNIRSTDKTVVISPSAGYWTKIWPMERWAEVARTLAEHNIRVILVGAPNERDYRKIADMPGVTAVDLIGQLTLLQSGALMKRASLVVGSDNGAMHLAAAAGADTLTLFGPTSLLRWQCKGSGKNETITKHQWCSPCGRLNSCPINKECMIKISSKEVAEKIISLIQNKNKKINKETTVKTNNKQKNHNS